MGEVQITIEGEFKKTQYPNLNPQLAVIIRQIFKEVVNTIEDKSKEFARGKSMPPQHVGEQSKHPIGKSESGYVLTGELERGIQSVKPPIRGYSFSAVIKSTSPISSYLEFGTGIYGKHMQIIKPKTADNLTFKTPKFGWVNTSSVKGQRPNPFLRGSVWWVQDHISEIMKKVRSDLDKKQIKELKILISVEME
jgi:hypothetical protein